MHNPSDDPYIKNLENEKLEIQEKIDGLRNQLMTIDTLIIKRKSQLLAGAEEKKITRKNADRLFYESLILTIISFSKNGMRTADIQKEIRKRGHKLNYNTLRAYVVSLRNQRKITKDQKRIYNWVVAEPQLNQALNI